MSRKRRTLGGFRGEHERQARSTDAMEEGHKRHKKLKNLVHTSSCTKGHDLQIKAISDFLSLIALITSNNLKFK